MAQRQLRGRHPEYVSQRWTGNSLGTLLYQQPQRHVGWRHTGIEAAHWSEENKLYWVLDVQFGEDSFRIPADHSAGNVNALRQIACNTLRETLGMKGSFRSRQLECLLDEQALSRAAETMGFDSMPPA